MLLRVLIGVLLIILQVVNAGRILAILPSPSTSHQIWNRALITALSKRGHEITVLSPAKSVKDVTSVKEIFLQDTHKLVNVEHVNEELSNRNYMYIITELWKRSIQLCHHQLNTKGALGLLKLPSKSFDLILVETIMNDCFNLYLDHFGGGTEIPVVGLTSIGTGPWTDNLIGNRALPSITALPILPYSNKMTIWQRFHNTLLTIFTYVGMSIYYFPEHQKIAEEVYGMPLPPLSALGNNISIILANNHFSISGQQRTLPGIIEVAGLHCFPAKPLPLELINFVHGAEKGVIYINFGSALHSHNISKEIFKPIIEALASLQPKIRILWKIDIHPSLVDIPSNVLVQKWFPQQDILGHPKTILFITNGGLLSIQEAIFHGKPIVGVPFTHYQERNVKSVVALRSGIELDFNSITKNTLIEAIQKIIQDKSYHRNMHKLSSIFRDQPENPLDRAIFWTEYSLRHGAGRLEHIRSSSADLSWFSYYMIDIFLILTMLGLATVLVILYAYKELHNMFSANRQTVVNFKSSKKRK